ncbi:hypothetical protein DPMN_153961 [Dreissena polymorpha]|uniref:Sacsin/Nov domain-containing protein n=1 Tax=Dreissena polymorpha TaxID=45954 RepID=A0A9D4J9F0_DREPO|nr:hypothetical protein DPMN_153961 [Dreissena polymorpha]
MTERSNLTINWLGLVWLSISNRGIRKFLDVPIFPVLEAGSFDSKYKIKLVPLHKSDLLLKTEQTGNKCLDNDVERSLCLLGITVITQLPSWLSCDMIKEFVLRPTIEDVKQLLQRKARSIDQQTIDSFNKNATMSNRSQFLDFLSQFGLFDGDLVYLLRKLLLFRSIKQLEICIFVDSHTHFVHESEKDKFPKNIEFPDNCIIVRGKEEVIVKQLDCKKLTLHEFMRLHESFTTRLRSLLRDGYTDGLSVPKELLQNADDAGATEICFVYDERKHSDSRERLLSKSLSDFQGSALWCYNNKVFSEKDLRNIIKFNNSAKSEDVTTIGKFGLGFNAVYNITDIPSFISGADMVIFDPHEKYLDDNSTLKRSNGKRIPLSKRTLVKRHTDQFKPFQGMFGCNVLDDPFEPYQGTLFRFPLRTAQQADQSEICKTVYSHSEVQSLLEMLMKSAEKLLLFCQNVLSIKLFHISAHATASNEMKTIYMVQKDSFMHTGKSCTRLETGILKKVASVHENQCDFGMEEHHTVNIRQTFYEHASLFPNIIYSGADLNVTWLVTWVSKNGPKQLQTVDTVPLVAVATPCKTEDDWTCQPLETLTKGNYDTGHMFCFLPLPIKTGLSFHINGCFRVSDDRQRLTLLNEDDKTSGSKCISHAWNIFLLQDPLVSALLSHIQITNSFCQRNEDAYRVWPHNFNPDLFPFVASLYRAVVDQNQPVFRDQRNSMSFNKILILEKITFNSHFGAFFDFLLNVPFVKDRTVVDVPDFVCNNLRLFNKDKTSIVERAFISKTDALVHFLHHISDPYWANKESVRNNMLAWTIMEADKKIKQCFKTIACITTQPFGRLRSVLDLVHPESQLAKMFFETDERFITKCEKLNEPKIYTKLVEFGMNCGSLPTDLIFDRCASLEDLAKKCMECARIRMGYLLKYLAESNIPKDTFDQLRCRRILPVLQKPCEWSFTWEADTNENHLVCELVVNCSKHISKKNPILVLGKPGDLFRQDCYSTVGSVQSIVDEKDWISSTLLKNLGVKNSHHLTIPVVMEQLQTVGNEFEDGK